MRIHWTEQMDLALKRTAQGGQKTAGEVTDILSQCDAFSVYEKVLTKKSVQNRLSRLRRVLRQAGSDSIPRLPSPRYTPNADSLNGV